MYVFFPSLFATQGCGGGEEMDAWLGVLYGCGVVERCDVKVWCGVV